MEHPYTAVVSSQAEGFVGAPKMSAEYTSDEMMDFQEPQTASVPPPAAPFQPYYITGEAPGVMAGVCTLPAVTPSAFMPLQQQQVSSSSTVNNQSNTASGTAFGNAGPLGGGINPYGSGFVPSTYAVSGSAPTAFYPLSGCPVESTALSYTEAVATTSCPLPHASIVGIGGTTDAVGVQSLTSADTAAVESFGASSAASSAAIPGTLPDAVSLAAPMGSAAAVPDGTAENVAASTSVAAGLPPMVALECLSAEERGLLQQTRRLLEEGISNTFECITFLSGVLLSRGASSLIHHLLQAWEEAGQQQQNDEKMLCLLYVMNDALQKCRRRGCPLLLLLALQPLHRFCCKIAKQHESVLRSCIRVIRILKDAKAFGPLTKRGSTQIAEALIGALQGNGDTVPLPPMSVIQQVLEASGEETTTNDASVCAPQQGLLRQPGQQQEDNAGIDTGDFKSENKVQQQLLRAFPGGLNGGVGGSVGSDGLQPLQRKMAGHRGAAMIGFSAFLQHANSSSMRNTLPPAIDTFLLQYPTPGDEAVAVHINNTFPEDPQEAALRQQISDVLNAIAAAQTALADKAIARRRVEEQLRDIQYERQRLRERAERIQRAAAGGAQAQLLLWQQMQQQLQQGGERTDFSLEGIAAEQERLGNLVRAAHAKLRVLLKTEWNRRVELQAALLSLGQAIEERLDVILPQHVHCREVKGVIDRAALLQASRQQRKEQQERQDPAEEGQQQSQQQHEEESDPGSHVQQVQQPLEDPHGEQALEESTQQHVRRQGERQGKEEDGSQHEPSFETQASEEHITNPTSTTGKSEKAEEQLQLPPVQVELPEVNPSETQTLPEEESDEQQPQRENGQPEEPCCIENDSKERDEEDSNATQGLQPPEGEPVDVGDKQRQLSVSPSQVDECGKTEADEQWRGGEFAQEHMDNNDDDLHQLEEQEEQPFERIEAHDGWLV